MRAINNMRIKTKILAGFIVVVAILAATATEAVVSLGKVNNTYNIVIDHPMEARSAIQDFISSYRDLRRMNMAIVAYTGYNIAKCEDLYTQAQTACTEAEGHLDDFERAVQTNPSLKQADKDSRIAAATAIRNKLKQYKSDFLEKTIACARESGEDPDSQEAIQGHQKALGILETGGQVATDIRTMSLEMHDAVVSTAETAVDTAHKEVKSSTIALVVISIIAVILSVFIAIILANSITGDINFLSGVMSELTKTGNFKTESVVVNKIKTLSERKGAIGLIFNSFHGLIDMMNHKLSTLEDVANGDLTTTVVHRSDNDSYGIALQKMVDSLNDMFSEIKTATAQVTVGSSQIADGAQVLASGASEQAATLQELTATVEDVSKKTRENAERTNNANRLAENIMKNAEKGTKQMEAMINAVNEINAANQNISKVIKAIDDIAFQTNILALNAAVEAARAGSAGKGFAIVAEEVRNLAGKSAESAKDTSELISNSIEKAQLGTQIAGETATSLTDIVSGINESNEIIAEIARSSEQQTEAISQINFGINSVTQVVQQSSAATEQSAAASEQMNGQAVMLEELVKRFRLRA